MSSHKQGSKVPGAQRLVADAVTAKAPTPKAKPLPAAKAGQSADARTSRHILRRTLLIALPLVGITALVWLAGNMYVAKYQIGTRTVYAHLPDAQLQTMVSQAAQSYKLSLADSSTNKPAQQFTLPAMGLHADAQATVVALRHQQHTLSGRLAWWRPTPMSLVTTADQAAFTAFIDQHVADVTQAPKDATLSISDGAAKITDGATGKAYGLSSPQQAILNAVAQLHAAPLQRHMVTAEPAITAAELQRIKTNINQVLHQHITFGMDGESTSPNAGEIATWLDLKPDDTAKTIVVGVNKERVLDYVNQVASDHSHPARAQVRLSSGSVIPGAAGTTFTNQQSVVDTITQQLLAAKGLHADLAAQHTPYKTISASVSGKWIEVDLTSKRMYVYQQTSLQRTFLVSAGKPGTPTVTGQYAIYSKFARQTMTGANADGSNYVQPNVPWISYFYRDYAIHGNYWRPASYFGSINSSHGCVGLTPSDALWVYNWAPIGTPVVIHT